MTDNEMLRCIYSDMQGMKQDMQGMKQDMQNMKQDMQGMKQDMQNMKQDMQGMKQDIQDMKQDIRGVERDVLETNQRVAHIDSSVTDIKLTLENEIRVNIQRVAEGHLDLSRNMHEMMKPNNEIEMLAIKVSMLETDMREVKQKIL